MRMERKWTPAQKSAIDTRDCNVLVSAAAGSGKTAVLVERIISMITDPDKNIDIDRSGCCYIYKGGSSPDERQDKKST
ncbi:MAG: UvrD-helicase domain-containing protein [Lachnospira eligens]